MSRIVNTLSGHVGAVYQVTWSPDSRYIASASKDSTIKIWKPKEKKALFTLSGHCDEVYALDWNPFGICVASGGKDRVVKMYVVLIRLLSCVVGSIKRNENFVCLFVRCPCLFLNIYPLYVYFIRFVLLWNE